MKSLDLLDVVILDCQSLLWNTRLNEAEKIIQPYHEQHYLWGSITFTEVAFWRYSFTEEPKDREAVFNRIEGCYKLIEKLQSDANNDGVFGMMKKLFSNESNNTSNASNITPQEKKETVQVHTTIASAELELALSLLNFKEHSFVKGAYHFRKSWKLYEEMLPLIKAAENNSNNNNNNSENSPRGTNTSTNTNTNNPSNQTSISYSKYLQPGLVSRLKFGLGLFHFVISLLPPTFLWMAEMIGFEGDKENALQMLGSASFSPHLPRAPHSSLLLAALEHFIFGRVNVADELLQKLVSRYPSSAVCFYLYGVVKRVEGKIEESATMMENALQKAVQGNCGQLSLTIEYELGHVYFLQGEWALVIPIIEKYLGNTKSKNFKCYGSFKLGYCYWMTGQKEKITEIFTRVSGFVRPTFTFDRFANRKAQKFLKEGSFSRFDEKAIAASSFLEGKNYHRAINTIEEGFHHIYPGSNMSELDLIEMFSNFISDTNQQARENWGLYNYLLGCSLKGLYIFETAKKHLLIVLNLEGYLIEETYILPHACVELAEIDLENAMAMLDHENATNSPPNSLNTLNTDTDFDSNINIDFNSTEIRASADIQSSIITIKTPNPNLNNINNSNEIHPSEDIQSSIITMSSSLTSNSSSSVNNVNSVDEKENESETEKTESTNTNTNTPTQTQNHDSNVTNNPNQTPSITPSVIQQQRTALLDSASNYLKKAQGYGVFDFDKVLNYRIKKDLERLNTELNRQI